MSEYVCLGMHVSECVKGHNTHVEVRGKLEGIVSLSTICKIQGLNQGSQCLYPLKYFASPKFLDYFLTPNFV